MFNNQMVYYWDQKKPQWCPENDQVSAMGAQHIIGCQFLMLPLVHILDHIKLLPACLCNRKSPVSITYM